MTNFYEFLQISPNADSETIHRVYRFLAARFHPDNQASGDAGMFNQLKTAYDVLSDPRRRAEYDNVRKESPIQPLSSAVDFMDNMEGELNRRLAVLAILYYRRRTNPNQPEISLAELEDRIGFPRDYLDFTMWYLQKKSYISKADSAQYSLTAEGVDFVETERGKVPTLQRLLTSSSEQMAETPGYRPTDSHALDKESMMSGQTTTPAIVNTSARIEQVENQRLSGKERRVGAPDVRVIKVERRGHVKDRRYDLPSRRRVN